MFLKGAGDAGAAARARMQSSALQQAMQAFKAVVPQCGLLDFRDWQSLRGGAVGSPPDPTLSDQVILQVLRSAHKVM